jgi:outer membrane receptor protein involved in Fe transport
VTRLSTGDAVYTIPNANTNSGDVSTGGLDFQVSAQHDLADLVGSSGDLGALDLSVSLSLLTQFFDPNGASNCGSTNLKGTLDFCGTTVFATADIRPAIRWNTHLGYTFEDWRAQLTWNHIGGVNDDFGFGDRIPSYDTFDLALRWNFSEHYSADLVINNLFDKGPPLGPYSALGGINTIAEAYDVLGRQASIQLTAKL